MVDIPESEQRYRGQPGRLAHNWKPGQSGNPGGRPRQVADLRAKAREYTQQALDVLVAALSDKSPYVRIAAAREILDRGYGRPVTQVELQAHGLRPIEIVIAQRPESEPRLINGTSIEVSNGDKDSSDHE
jgi:hypothetical protein